MLHRWLSDPLLYLLRQSSLGPADLDAALDVFARRRDVAKLHPGHAAIDDLRQTARLNIVEVGRRHRRLLVKIEELTNRRPGWAYREMSFNNCIFTCPGTIPDVNKSALVGRPLSSLAQPHPALNNVRIKYITDSADGWSEVHVDPDWIAFEVETDRLFSSATMPSSRW